ncbi:MAG: Gx transporter family protein [Treponema sp.]|nr:Gx transporter family protein [Treponema sp.]
MQKLTPQSGNTGHGGFEGFSRPAESTGFVNKDLALLSAFCFFLSALDHLIPKPLPFMRIGLANLPLLIAMDIFSSKRFFLLALIKILGQGLITGTLFSYVALFSLAGTAVSAAFMFLLRRHCRISLVGTGIAGAFVSNAAQLFLARFFLFGEGARYLVPPFLAMGILSGGFLGFFAEAFSAQSQWIRFRREYSSAPGIAETGGSQAAVDAPSRMISFWTMALVFLAVLFLVVPYLQIRTALFLFFWILALKAGKNTRPVFTVVSMMMITACNLFPPFGKILFQAGPFVIAGGSLMRGLQRAVTMEGLIMFSRLALDSIPPLPGKAGSLLQESFRILERMNKIFEADAFKPKEKNRGKGKARLLKKLDKLLCEASGCSGEIRRSQ